MASGIFSPVESIASSMSTASSHCGPFTPADSLSMTALTLNRPGNQPVPDCVPENVDGDGITSELGYAGYTWGTQAIWPDTSEVVIPDDFDLSCIPPIEIGTTLPDQTQGYEGEETPYPYPEPGSDQDPFASFFSNYGGVTW